MERLGIRLRRRRLQSGRSASDLAREAGWTQTYWHALEDGSRQAPGPEQIDVVARALGVAPAIGLLADLTLEQLWWGLTAPRSAHIAYGLVRDLIPTTSFLQSETEWLWLIERNYPSATNDPGRRVHTTVSPTVDRTAPETWPRPLLVDVLCYRVSALKLSTTDVQRDGSDEVGLVVPAEDPPGIAVWTAVVEEGDSFTRLLKVPVDLGL